jgi:hypothetical protein
MQQDSNSNNAQSSALLGALVAGIGVAVAVLIYLQPEGLQVPLWVAMFACLCFVFAGGAIAAQPQSSPVIHQCMVLGMLLVMTAIPAWISFGPGDRQCSSNVPYFNGVTSCRFVFGLSTVCMLFVLAIAVKQTWRLYQARKGLRLQ